MGHRHGGSGAGCTGGCVRACTMRAASRPSGRRNLGRFTFVFTKVRAASHEVVAHARCHRRDCDCGACRLWTRRPGMAAAMTTQQRWRQRRQQRQRRRLAAGRLLDVTEHGRRREPLVGRLRVLRGRHGRRAGPPYDACFAVFVANMSRGRSHINVDWGGAGDQPRAVREAAAGHRHVADVRRVRSGGRSRAGQGRDPVPRLRHGVDARCRQRCVPGAGRDRHRRAGPRHRHRQGVPHHDRHAGRRVSDAAVRRRQARRRPARRC